VARSLSPDEAQLWARVTATIRPLSREPEKIPELEGPVAVPKPPVSVTPKTSPVRRAPPAPAAPARPGKTLDGTWDRKLRNGSIQPDQVVDLHGMTLDRAWAAIDTALERASEVGDRVILLVTGHHRPGEPPIQRGRIRAVVHDWLAVSRHASKIAAVRGAHPRHGGGGSLYIVLRRR
jgi:DNA-nicking Smr family endonuclease